MRIIVAALFAAALLMLSACSEKTEELSTTDPTGTLPFPSDAGPRDPELSTTDPTGTLPFPSDAGPRDPSRPNLPPPTTTTAIAARFDADTTRTGRDVPAPGTDAPPVTDGTGSRP